jgi:hypothetical protein
MPRVSIELENFLSLKLNDSFCNYLLIYLYLLTTKQDIFTKEFSFYNQVEEEVKTNQIVFFF